MIAVIGTVRGDIIGNPYGQVVREEHNPGTLSMEFAGAGMNLCRNLKALEEEVMFFSVAGEDLPGKAAKTELSQRGVDVENFLLLPGRNTAMSLEIRNIVDDLEMAFGNKDIMEKIDSEYMRSRLESLKAADLVICDASCSQSGWRVLLEERGDVPLIVDPDGVEEGRIAAEDLKYIHTLIPGRREAEIISGLEILSEDQLREAGKWFISHGVKRIFITLSGGGVYCREGEEEHILRPKSAGIVSTKGAGDGFSSGAAAAQSMGRNLFDAAEYAMAVAQMTLDADGYVNGKLSKEELERRSK